MHTHVSSHCLDLGCQSSHCRRPSIMLKLLAEPKRDCEKYDAATSLLCMNAGLLTATDTST